MFTLKFFKHTPNGDSQTVVCCNHYEVNTHRDGAVVITYKDHTESGGVERHIAERPSTMADGVHLDIGYEVCFVENSQGKTIDRIRRP